MDTIAKNRMIFLASLPKRNKLESHFAAFRPHIIGQNTYIDTRHGRERLLYADWTASGRGYRPIETMLQEEVLPYFANTHTETTYTGKRTTEAYEQAKNIIKNHVHAGDDDVLLFCGSGMTAAVNKLQRIMGLKKSNDDRPLVLVTHMEHHSNHISWLETNADVAIIRPTPDGNVDLDHLEYLLKCYADRKQKIAAITACSNVTGIITPYHTIAAIMHKHGGHCFVDFAASAPYVSIDMHPDDPDAYLDAIY